MNDDALKAILAELQAMPPAWARPKPPKRPSFERQLADLRHEVMAEQRPAKGDRPRCGARCRDGHACRAPVVVMRDEYGLITHKARCRMHGGLSTGARTPEGRARLREAGRRGAAERWRRWREARATA